MRDYEEKVRTQLRWKVGDLEKKSLCYYLYFRTPPVPMTAVLVMQWRSGGKSCDLPGSWRSQGALRWRQSWKRAKIRSLVHEVADPPPQVRESFSEVSFVSAGPSVRFEAVCSRFRLT